MEKKYIPALYGEVRRFDGSYTMDGIVNSGAQCAAIVDELEKFIKSTMNRLDSQQREANKFDFMLTFYPMFDETYVNGLNNNTFLLNANAVKEAILPDYFCVCISSSPYIDGWPKKGIQSFKYIGFARPNDIIEELRTRSYGIAGGELTAEKQDDIFDRISQSAKFMPPNSTSNGWIFYSNIPDLSVKIPVLNSNSVHKYWNFETGQFLDDGDFSLAIHDGTTNGRPH